jgi:hypothetical protein
MRAISPAIFANCGGIELAQSLLSWYELCHKEPAAR